jgi:hypothetical protein
MTTCCVLEGFENAYDKYIVGFVLVPLLLHGKKTQFGPRLGLRLTWSTMGRGGSAGSSLTGTISNSREQIKFGGIADQRGWGRVGVSGRAA